MGADDLRLFTSESVTEGHPDKLCDAVADAVYLIEDRDGGVTRPQEVGVQRVDPPLLHRAARGDQGLARHLPAEDALAILLGADAAEDVDLDRLEVEELAELVDGVLSHATV